MLFIKRIFAWWEGATIGLLWTLRGQRFVGEDDYGNRYFEQKKGASFNGRPRRWVVYNGYADASRVPSDWHGWLHHTFAEAPSEAPLRRQKWETEHQPNLTGTLWAYRPRGSLWRSEDRAPTSSDYESWNPDAGEGEPADRDRAPVAP